MSKSILAIATVCATLAVAQWATAESRISDIQLDQRGTLHGQIVTRAGQPVANKDVTIVQGEVVIARAKTDARGHFAVANMNSGVYGLQAAGRTSTHRLWAADIAPPAAHRGVMVVSGSQTARGQLAGLGALGGVAGSAAVIGGGYYLVDQVILTNNNNGS